MYSLLVNVIRHEQKFVQKTSWQVIWMLARVTTRNDETRNFKSYSRSFEIYFCCCRYRLFRFNSSVWYSEVQSVLRNREISATISTMSTSISWVKFADSIVRMLSWFCIDVIQTTTSKRKRRNRQEESKRIIRSLDHNIFCEISFKIRNSCIEFVCFSSLVSISLLSQLLRIFLVIDSLVTTYSRNRLQKDLL